MKVAGVDLSTKAIDIVTVDIDPVDEVYPSAWHRFPLEAADAWARTLLIRDALPNQGFWEDIALVAIEAPYGRGQSGTLALLNRVVGAIVASLPPQLRTPERCWIVRPDEWKTGLGLSTAKPAALDLGVHGYAGFDEANIAATIAGPQQDARDAWALARWAMNELDKAAAAA